MNMAIRYFKTKTGRMLASLPNGEMIEGKIIILNLFFFPLLIRLFYTTLISSIIYSGVVLFI